MEGIFPTSPLVLVLIGIALGSAGLLLISRIFRDLLEAVDNFSSPSGQKPPPDEFQDDKPTVTSKRRPKPGPVVAAPPPAPPTPLQETRGFRTLFESFLGGAATLNEAGHVTSTNQSLRERLGYLAGELEAQPFINLIHPEDRGWILTFFRGLHDGTPGQQNGVPSLSRELRCYDKAGSLVWVHLALSILPRSEIETAGQPFSLPGTAAPAPVFEPAVILAMLTDVTRRRQAENAAARLSAGVNDLYQVVADRSLNLPQQMQASLSLGCHLFEMRTGVLATLKDDCLEFAAVVSPDERLRVGRVYELSPDAPAQRPALPEPLRRPGFQEWREKLVVVENERETFLSAPIFIAGKIYGVLYFSEGNPRAAAFESEQVQFCQLMALWVGSEIERHRRREREEKKGAELEKANTQLQAMATQDALTGVKNRRAFDERLQAEWSKSIRDGAPLSVILMDVDKFKHYNDSFGHPAGDEVLKQVGRILGANVREGGFVGRYGGEEFVALLPATDSESALAAGERFRAAIESAAWKHREVTASFGVATTNPGITTPAELVSAADGALYTSKTDGRNRVSLAR